LRPEAITKSEYTLWKAYFLESLTGHP
jgi:hypothetical protein